MITWTSEAEQKLRLITGETIRPGGLEITDKALRFCNFPKHSRILDAGCGVGSTTRHLSDHHEIAAFGIDLSLSSLKEIPPWRDDLPLTRGRLESLPFGGETFDGVICECVLSLTLISHVLEEFSRVLKIGGFLILSDLYRRKTDEIKTIEGLRNPSCLGKDQLAAALADSHFETLLWEDRTTDLKKLAAQLIMKCGSMAEILSSAGRAAFPCRKEENAAWRELGYYLLIAKKTMIRKGALKK